MASWSFDVTQKRIILAARKNGEDNVTSDNVFAYFLAFFVSVVLLLNDEVWKLCFSERVNRQDKFCFTINLRYFLNGDLKKNIYAVYNL